MSYHVYREKKLPMKTTLSVATMEYMNILF